MCVYIHIHVCACPRVRVRVYSIYFFFTNVVGVIRRVIIRAIQGNSFQAHRWKIYKYSIL